MQAPSTAAVAVKREATCIACHWANQMVDLGSVYVIGTNIKARMTRKTRAARVKALGRGAWSLVGQLFHAAHSTLLVGFAP